MTPVVTTALSLVYVLPIALLALYFTARSDRQPRWLLIAVLSALPVFYAGHYLLLQEIQGWPSDADPPPEFRLLGFDIGEPGPGAAEDGRILLWIHAAGDPVPRVHRLAYSRELHQELVAAGKRLSEGRGQTGIRSQRPAASMTQANDFERHQIRFEDTRDTVLPAKE